MGGMGAADLGEVHVVPIVPPGSVKDPSVTQGIRPSPTDPSRPPSRRTAWEGGAHIASNGAEGVAKLLGIGVGVAMASQE